MATLIAHNLPHVDVGDEARAPVARVENLSVRFWRDGRDVAALRGVSLEVRPGEILGIVGESGSGKSVLGLSLLGLLPSNPRPLVEGRVLVHGVDMVHAPPERRRQVRRQHLGAVFQDPMTSLNPTMPVGRQVAEAAGSASRAQELLEAVGVPDAAHRMSSFPHQLSGGLRQRVMIAMAMAGSPSLVVADEPTTALDVTVQAQVLALMRSLCDERACSFLLITHDLGVAGQVADRLVVMYGGRVLEVGSTEMVLRSSAHPYGLALLRSRLSLRSERGQPVTTLPGEPPDPASPPPGCPFQPRCGLASAECSTTLLEPRPVAPGHLSACRLSPAELAARREPDRVEMVPPHPAGGRGRSGREPVVRLTGVVKSYRLRGGRPATLAALRGVDLEVASGESVAVVGESGSGKSTLLRIIAGLERADRGEVVLAPGVRPQMVFQDAGASLTPWMTVEELVGERLGRQGDRAWRRERVRVALARVGLPAGVARARAAQLSGGQRQRVALARATVVPPGVLLCDEPTSALDVSLAAVVINLITRLRRELDMSVVFVTHDLAVGRMVADRIAVVHLGTVVEVGPSEDVIRTPRHPYTRALLDAVPEPGRPLGRPRGEPPSPLRPPPGCSFHPRCPVALPACAHPDLRLGLARLPGGIEHRVACLRVGEV